MRTFVRKREAIMWGLGALYKGSILLTVLLLGLAARLASDSTAHAYLASVARTLKLLFLAEA
jgi:3-oxoacyl-ACP reductase-like protein